MHVFENILVHNFNVYHVLQYQALAYGSKANIF